MRTWSRLLRERRCLAAILVALALSMKMLVPAGYMIGAGPKIVTVQICTDASASGLTRQMAIPLRKDAGGQPDRGKGDATCAWAALAKAAEGGAGPDLMALALAFILALGFAGHAARPRPSPRHLRPPLRGPPLSA